MTLINDILRLSELDEGGSLPTEPVELLSLCTDTVKSLESAAQQRQITMTVTGEAVTVPGVRRLLTETIFNLCDNAIKYNKDGGSVAVAVGRDGPDAVVTVADTGIGIPPEHQGRVFERFYRVDKSHSKASAVPDWACPSSSTPWLITTAPSRWTAVRGMAPPLPSACRWKRKRENARLCGRAYKKTTR